MNYMMHRFDAFSLIELMIVIALSLLLIGGGYVGYSRSSQQKKWSKDIEAVRNIITLGIEKTQHRDITTGTCTTFSGYRIDVAQATNTLTLSALCPGTVEFTRYMLLHSTIRSTTSPQVSISYPYGTLSSEEKIVLKNNFGSECQDIIISPEGVITTPATYGC